MKACRLIFFFVALLTTFSATAQDAHHSQYFNLPAYYNPAAAGQDVEHIRLTGMYRKQWPGLSTPFVTQSIVFDKQVSKVGFGAVLNNNTAGDAGIKRMQLGAMISYRFQFHDHQLASGISIGFIQKSFDPSKMTFDDQYHDDIGYDPANPTSEQFAFTKVIRPDFSAGFLWSHGDIQKTRWVPYAGASLMHINQPDEILIEQANTTPMKTVLGGGFRFSVNEKVEIDPSVQFSKQQFANELLFGTKAVYKFDKRTNVQAGIYIRNKDAAIAYAGYQWNSLMIGVSYDANISHSVSGPGAFELSLTYIPKAKIKKEKKVTEKPATEKKPAATKKPAAPSANKKSETTPSPKDSSEKAVSVKPEKPVDNKSQPKVKEPAKPATEKAKPAETKTPPAKATEKPRTEKSSTPVVTKPDINVITDSDKDGIADKEDDCPYMKGNAAMRGCPDTDNDGVTDLSDRCPLEKGSAANNGCPQKNTVPKQAEQFIKFDVNSAKLSGFDVIDILEPVSDSLYYDKSLKLVITGHTDAEGDEAYNMELSKARAEAVKAYFIKHGIPPEKIEVVGYGETKPHTENDSEDGKRRNRRAEVYLTR
jgi:type IX secretion system PorP/SprF family membrane protein